jgi:hypothetical protein
MIASYYVVTSGLESDARLAFLASMGGGREDHFQKWKTICFRVFQCVERTRNTKKVELSRQQEREMSIISLLNDAW